MLTLEQFESAYREHADPLYGYAFRRLGDEAAAQDLVSDAFFKALRALDRFDESKGSVKNWLYSIASRLMVDKWRKEAPLVDDPDAAEAVPDGAPDPARAAIAADDLRRAVAALADLPADTREVVSLRIWEDLPFADIAAILGIREDAAKMRFSRGIARVRDVLVCLLLFLIAW